MDATLCSLLTPQSQPQSSKEAVNTLLYDVTFRWLSGILRQTGNMFKKAKAGAGELAQQASMPMISDPSTHIVVHTGLNHYGNHTFRGPIPSSGLGHCIYLLHRHMCRQNSQIHIKLIFKKAKPENSSSDRHRFLHFQITSQVPAAVAQPASTYMLL